jgi:hypothetical protein
MWFPHEAIAEEEHARARGSAAGERKLGPEINTVTSYYQQRDFLFTDSIRCQVDDSGLNPKIAVAIENMDLEYHWHTPSILHLIGNTCWKQMMSQRHVAR